MSAEGMTEVVDACGDVKDALAAAQKALADANAALAEAKKQNMAAVGAAEAEVKAVETPSVDPTAPPSVGGGRRRGRSRGRKRKGGCGATMRGGSALQYESLEGGTSGPSAPKAEEVVGASAASSLGFSMYGGKRSRSKGSKSKGSRSKFLSGAFLRRFMK